MATFLVNTPLDSVNPTDDFTSLREALELANATAAPDIIDFRLVPDGSVIRLTGGPLQITQDVSFFTGEGEDIVISGDVNGDDPIILGSNGLTDLSLASPGDLDDNVRLFEVGFTADSVSFENLILTGGVVAGTGGGAIYRQEGAGDFALSLVNSSLVGNGSTAPGASGGAIRIDGDLAIEGTLGFGIARNTTQGDGARGGAAYVLGDVTITDGASIGNNATYGDTASGGAIFVRDGTFSMTDSTLVGNRTEGELAVGGALATENATVSIMSSTVESNRTEGNLSSGGGIFGQSVTLGSSEIRDNEVRGETYQGGGAILGESVVITESVVENNAVTGSGLGGAIQSPGFVGVYRSLFFGNYTAGTDSDGGAIMVFDEGEVVINNATFIDNRTTGISSNGGAIKAGDISVVDSTFTGNAAVPGGTEGGAILWTGTGSFNGALILGNTAGSSDDGADEIVGTVGNGTFQGRNIVGIDASDFDPGDLADDATVVNADPADVFAETQMLNGAMSAVLADNGGDRLSVALLSSTDNPALDRNTRPDNSLPDGRGFDRTVDQPQVDDFAEGSITDIGAFELEALNTPPVGADDFLVVDPETATVIPVLANDTDFEDDALSVVEIVSGPANGTAAVTGGEVVYTGADGFTGVDAFVYRLTDGEDTATARVEVTVAVSMGENLPPEAVDDMADAFQGIEREIDVLANDRDPEGGMLSIAAVTQPGAGSVAIDDETERLVYTAPAGFEGEETFTYTVQDPDGNGATAEVTVTVTENRAPSAFSDFVTAAENGVLTVDALANDTDPDGDLDMLSYLSVGEAANGGTAIRADGSGIDYTPNGGFTGRDSFSYTIRDASGATATASVFVVVGDGTTPTDDPTANDDAATSGGGEVEIDVLANDVSPDGVPLAILAVADPTAGSVRVSGDRIFYAPDEGFAGEDSFDYSLVNQFGEIAAATVTVTVSREPVAVDDAAAGVQFTPLFALDVTGNDENAEAVVGLSGLTSGNSARTEGGRVFNNGDGTLGYAPRRDFVGEDSFSYTIESADGSMATAEVTVEVGPIDPDLSVARLVGYLFEAGLGRQPATEGLNFYADRVLEEGATETELARGFLNSNEFEEMAGAPPEELSDRELVEELFLNVLDRPGAEAGIDAFVEDLAEGLSREQLLITFAESPENLLGSPEIATIEEQPDGTFDYA